MSRTYRHRHWPKLQGYAVKFVDARVVTPQRRIDARVESYYAHVMNEAPCLHGDPNYINPGWGSSHERCARAIGLPGLHDAYWRNSHADILRVSLGLEYPVAGLGNHPWAPWWTGGNGAKTYEKKVGNRRCRRKTRCLIGHLRYLDFDWEECDAHFPSIREEINPWNWD